MTIRLLLLAATYCLAGTIALRHFATLYASASPVWPPAGIALAAFMLLGPVAWPAIFVAAFVVNITVTESVLASLTIAAGNTVAGLLGAQLALRWANGARAFERAPSVFRFVGLAAVPSAALSADKVKRSEQAGGCQAKLQVASEGRERNRIRDTCDAHVQTNCKHRCREQDER